MALTAATRKNAPNKLKWTEDMCDNFCDLCNALSECCVLNIPCKRDRFLLRTDVPGYDILCRVVRNCPWPFTPAS